MSISTHDDLAALSAVLDAGGPLRRAAPGAYVLPDTHGVWVGLAGVASELNAALSAPPSRMQPAPDDASVLRWTDGAAASAGPGASVLQSVWGLGADLAPSGIPASLFGEAHCLTFSNRRCVHGTCRAGVPSNATITVFVRA